MRRFEGIGGRIAALTLAALGAAGGAAAQVVPAPASPVQPAMPVSPVAHIETRGSGPVHLILVPGISCDWSVWEGFMARNGERYTMHAVTLPGFGGSGPAYIVMGTRYSTPTWLDNARRALVKAADDLKIEKPVVVGHGLGGTIALDLGIEHGDRFGGVVSIEGLAAIPIAGPGQDLTPEQRRGAIDGSIASSYANQTDEQFQEVRRRNIATMTDDPALAARLAEMFAQVARSIEMRYLLEVLSKDLRPGLATMRTPALVIGAVPALPEGAKPEALEPARAIWREQFGGAPNVTLQLIEESRHFVMDQRPEAVDGAIAKFVQGLPQGSSVQRK